MLSVFVTQLFKVGLDPDHICPKLCLLTQQKLHRAFNFVRRHRMEFHGESPLISRLRHYAIVPRVLS